MKFNFTLPPLSLNPFKHAVHNGVPMLRIVNHLLHFGIGLGVWAVLKLLVPLVLHVTVPVWAIIIVMILASIWNKFSWIDVPNKKVYWWVPIDELMVWDCVGDTILTIVPILITICPLAMIPVYYGCSLLSDPY